MPRPPGLPKTGGRKQGTLNRSTQAIIDKLDELGCDPIEGLARIAMDVDSPRELRVRCYAELAQYVYPKRKAAESAADPEQSGECVFRLEFIGAKDGARATAGPTTDGPATLGDVVAQ